MQSIAQIWSQRIKFKYHNKIEERNYHENIGKLQEEMG